MIKAMNAPRESRVYVSILGVGIGLSLYCCWLYIQKDFQAKRSRAMQYPLDALLISDNGVSTFLLHVASHRINALEFKRSGVGRVMFGTCGKAVLRQWWGWWWYPVMPLCQVMCCDVIRPSVRLAMNHEIKAVH